MKKSKERQSKKRMVHIRLDETIHKHLKLEAVRQDTTLQGLVEKLILGHIKSPHLKDMK